MITYYEQGK